MYSGALLQLTSTRSYFVCKIVSHSRNGNAESVEIIATPPPAFSEETVVAIIGLGNIVRKIRARLLNEGYVVRDGNVTKKENYEQ